jgi:hypothetical protein
MGFLPGQSHKTFRCKFTHTFCELDHCINVTIIFCVVIMLNVVMLIVLFNFCYAECHYAECHYAECHDAI